MKAESFIVADTSAWISSFQKKGYDTLKQRLREALEKNVLAINGIIFCELLQGAKNELEYENLKARLEVLHYLPVSEEVWERAAQLSFNLRRQGITIPTTDAVIAQSVIETPRHHYTDDRCSDRSKCHRSSLWFASL
ncbi:PIN domain-containing protein [Candidatus Acetothermia bacterium]|nr:PIN domain-containing protein [Candidatus Acetothermia bacterium]